jgi:hypothetical protein
MNYKQNLPANDYREYNVYMSNKMSAKVQAVIVDQETAGALRAMAEKVGLSPSEMVRAGATLLRYALGRKVKFEGKRKVVEIDSLEKYNQVVDLDD